jgi:hypothetical protein
MISDQIYLKIEQSACEILDKMIAEEGLDSTNDPVRVDMSICADEDDRYYHGQVVCTVLADSYIVTATEVTPITIDQYISMRVDPQNN